jgi:hypothetical protein
VSDCTCLTMTELSQMMSRNEVVQSRYPCPVHGDGLMADVELLPRISMADKFISCPLLPDTEEER